jgi:hypothetical protein
MPGFVGVGALLVGLAGCAGGIAGKAEDWVKAGDPASAAFAVGWCTDEDPAKAGETAAANALKALGCPAKGLIFYEYFPKTLKGKDGKDKEVPDTEKEKKVLPGVKAAAIGVPVIGCRARGLVNGGTKLVNTVAALAIGGRKITCKAVKVELADDRLAIGRAIANGLKDVPDLKLVFALSEMRLSFETKEGVSVEDLIRGVLEAGKGVVLFGGNCMPNEAGVDLAGVQFIHDQMLAGHVVAMGIGGPIAVYANHTNEFTPSTETVTVTKAKDKWVYELDGKPAPEVYRQIRGMKPDEALTSDWQHPIGVIVSPEKVYLRMVLEEDKEKKGLRFVAAVPEGTKVKVLKGGADAQAILASAGEGVRESLAKAGGAKPLVVLLSDCCARGMRLGQFGKPTDCEVKDAILPALGAKSVLVFGFYAWGELGPIAGPFGGLTCMYQQHTFVSVVLCEAK